MINVDKIDIERLKNPEPLFKIMEPDQAKLDALADKLLNGYLYFSDEHRFPEYMRVLVNNIYSKSSFNLLYEIGEFQGVLGFMNMIFGHKADVMLKLWDPKPWGPDMARQGKRLIEYILGTFELVRLGTVTADPRIVKMARLVGFSEEGYHRLSFAWKGEFHDEILMSIVREER